MRRASGAFFAVLFLSLSACGVPADTTDDEAESRAPTITPTVTTTASPSPTPTLDEASVGFLTNIRHSPDFAERPDDELLAAGHQVCTDLSAGATYEQATAPITDAGAAGESAMVLASTAVFEFCPEHDAIIEVAMGGPANPQPDPVGDSRTAYLAALRADDYFADVTDDMLLMLGTTYCDGFTRGDSLETTFGYLGDMPRESALVMLRGAVTHICPEHADKLG